MGFTYDPLVEMWALYVVGSLIIFLRCACRWRMVGFRGFKPDDYIIWLSWVDYTIMSIAADVCGRHADLHTLGVEQRRHLAPAEAAPYVLVTQWFCAGVATYIVFVWSLKINMLFFFQRVVKGLWVEKFILPVMALVAGTFVVIIGLLFGCCRPYSRMWIVYPDQGAQCEPQAEIYMLPPLIMNVFTDLCIMMIPAPVILPLKTTIVKKIFLIFLFTAGFFIMIAAILRVTMVLVQGNGGTAAIWSCREDFVAIIVGQAPILRPAFSKKFWTGQMTYGSSTRPSKSAGSMPIRSGHDAFELGSSRLTKGSVVGIGGGKGGVEHNVTIMSARRGGGGHGRRSSDGDSTERIFQGHDGVQGGGIVVNTWVDVESTSMGPRGIDSAAAPGAAARAGGGGGRDSLYGSSRHS